MTASSFQLPVPCPHCDQPMRRELVKTAIWHNERLYMVEDIPAYVCDTCVEQFYDPKATDLLRTLTENGFSSAKAIREVLVPVFSLAGLVPMDRPIVYEQPEIY